MRALEAGTAFFETMPPRGPKSADVKAGIASKTKLLSLDSPVFGEAKSADAIALGSWARFRENFHRRRREKICLKRGGSKLSLLSCSRGALFLLLLAIGQEERYLILAAPSRLLVGPYVAPRRLR